MIEQGRMDWNDNRNVGMVVYVLFLAVAFTVLSIVLVWDWFVKT